MATYIKNTETGQIGKLQESPDAVKKMIVTGHIMGFEIVPATSLLREQAKAGIEVRGLRILTDGKIGYL